MWKYRIKFVVLWGRKRSGVQRGIHMAFKGENRDLCINLRGGSEGKLKEAGKQVFHVGLVPRTSP
jgi:hypothetical protein